MQTELSRCNRLRPLLLSPHASIWTLPFAFQANTLSGPTVIVELWLWLTIRPRGFAYSSHSLHRAHTDSNFVQKERYLQQPEVAL